MRLSRDALVGLVGRRGRGAIAARRISSTRRASASTRLSRWVRWRGALITKIPSRVRRLPASRMRRLRTSSGNDGERPASKRSWTALETLLTFWPPGPDARMKLSSISRSSMAMAAVMRLMRAHHRKAGVRSFRAGSRDALGLADNGDEKTAIEQPLGHAPRVVQRHGIDHFRPAAEIVDVEAVKLQLHQQCRDLGRGIEIESERAVEVRLGIGQLLRRRSVVGQALDFLLDHVEVFARAIGACRGTAEKQGRVV